MFFFSFLLALFFSLVFLFLIFFLFYYNDVIFSKSSSFECGFQPMDNFNSFFSFPFFVYSLMFLVFDVEIIIISSFPFFVFYSFSLWFVLFLVGLITFYEWKVGLLGWIFSFFNLVST